MQTVLIKLKSKDMDQALYMREDKGGFYSEVKVPLSQIEFDEKVWSRGELHDELENSAKLLRLILKDGISKYTPDGLAHKLEYILSDIEDVIND